MKSQPQLTIRPATVHGKMCCQVWLSVRLNYHDGDETALRLLIKKKIWATEMA